MKVEQSREYPIEWQPCERGDVAKMIHITCGGESIILKGDSIFKHHDGWQSVCENAILVVSKRSEEL